MTPRKVRAQAGDNSVDAGGFSVRPPVSARVHTAAHTVSPAPSTPSAAPAAGPDQHKHRAVPNVHACDEDLQTIFSVLATHDTVGSGRPVHAMTPMESR